jgi:hypothetical protein
LYRAKGGKVRESEGRPDKGSIKAQIFIAEIVFSYPD